VYGGDVDAGAALMISTFLYTTIYLAKWWNGIRIHC